MANIASVLKEEISRIARKELRSETDNLKKASGRYRSEIAALKRRIAELEQQVARLAKTACRPAPAAPVEEPASRSRYSPKVLRTQRERLGLSAAELARMFDVSAQTIYNWEAGTTRPKPVQIAAIATLRKLGKREVQAILEQLA